MSHPGPPLPHGTSTPPIAFDRHGGPGVMDNEPIPPRSWLDDLADVAKLVVGLASVGVCAGLVAAAWAITGHWHTAISGRVNLSRNDMNGTLPAWVFNIGYPAIILWMALAWWWDSRHVRRAAVEAPGASARSSSVPPRKAARLRVRSSWRRAFTFLAVVVWGVLGITVGIGSSWYVIVFWTVAVANFSL